MKYFLVLKNVDFFFFFEMMKMYLHFDFFQTFCFGIELWDDDEKWHCNMGLLTKIVKVLVLF